MVAKKNKHNVIIGKRKRYNLEDILGDLNIFFRTLKSIYSVSIKKKRRNIDNNV